MRTPALCLLFAVLSGCQSASTTESALRRPYRSGGGGFDDASFRAGDDNGTPQVLALDPIVAQLLRASFSAYEHQRRVLLENVTNVNTCGYKKRVVRTTLQTITGSDGQSFQMPVVQGTEAIFTTGTLECTGRNLDVAIDGEGFFAVTLFDGSTGYTRDGVLQIHADGKLVTGAGNVVSPEITLANDTLEIAVAPDGLVTGRTAGSPDTTTVFGQLTIHRFVNPAGLRLDNGIYHPTEASNQPITNTPGLTGHGILKQGFLERSNVQLTAEMVDLQILEKQHDSLVRTMRQFGMVAP